MARCRGVSREVRKLAVHVFMDCFFKIIKIREVSRWESINIEEEIEKMEMDKNR